MSNLYGNTTKLFSTPYLTVDEYKSAPTAIDYNNLVVDSADPAVQDAELANVIARASSWIDKYCFQVLAATEETEQTRARLNNDGYISIHPKCFPIVAVTSCSFGTSPANLVEYPDLSQGWVEEQQFILPWSSGYTSYSSQGALQFGMPGIPRAMVYVKYTYVSGYANTTITADTAIGATTITVDSAAGITAGSRMTIFDGMSTESIVVASTYTYGSKTVPVATALQFAHTAGASVSALPPAVKEAAILATTAFLKVRGDYSMTMQLTSSVGTPSNNTHSLNYDLDLAKELLKDFRRVR